MGSRTRPAQRAVQGEGGAGLPLARCLPLHPVRGSWPATELPVGVTRIASRVVPGLVISVHPGRVGGWGRRPKAWSGVSHETAWHCWQQRWPCGQHSCPPARWFTGMDQADQLVATRPGPRRQASGAQRNSTLGRRHVRLRKRRRLVLVGVRHHPTGTNWRLRHSLANDGTVASSEANPG